MKPSPIVIETENGWEPAFWDENLREYVIEPGFALPTRAEAQASLDRDIAQSDAIDAQQRIYESQMAYACGYRD